MSGELIDYTAAALHARWEKFYDQGDFEECVVLTELIEGYLDGTWAVKWQGGDPYFSMSEEAPDALLEMPDLAGPTEAPED
jgi:hypothetical protein